MIITDTIEFHKSKKPSMQEEITMCSLITDLAELRILPQSYGALIAMELKKREVSHQGAILEVGGGIGDLADGFMKYYQGNNGFEWTFADVCPSLLYTQKTRPYPFPVKALPADAQKLAKYVEPGTIDLVISNEMIGDLDTVEKITEEDLLAKGTIDGFEERRPKLKQDYLEVLRIFHSYKLDRNNMPPEGAGLNLGAVQFIEQLHKVLKPGGYAFISENDCEALGKYPWPRIMPLEGHYEYSIKFSHLAHVAKQLGFEVEKGNLADFLKLPDLYAIESKSYDRWAAKHPMSERTLQNFFVKYNFPLDGKTCFKEPVKVGLAITFTPQFVKDFAGINDTEFNLLFQMENHRDKAAQCSYLLLKKV